LAPGQHLLALLCDPTAPPAEMHALVDAAASSGGSAWIGLHGARDSRGRTPLHLSVTRGDLSLCRKLLQHQTDARSSPGHLLALDDNKVCCSQRVGPLYGASTPHTHFVRTRRCTWPPLPAAA